MSQEKENGEEKKAPAIGTESENIHKIENDTGADSATIPSTDDIAERVTAFNTELKRILGKYELALAAEPRIHEGRIVADPRVLDARKK